MDTGEFLAGPEAERIIARAAKVARTAVSVHACGAGHEADKVVGCGARAEACAFVHTLPWGPQACRRSREKHSRTALKRGRPVPYLCHMGFACVAAPAVPETDGAFAVTFGPYCPAETPKALERDAIEGLARLEQLERKELPFSLDDIPRVPAEVVPEVAEWLSETLTKQAIKALATGEVSPMTESPIHIGRGTVTERIDSFDNSSDSPPSRLRSPVKRRTRVDRDPFGARSVLAAMANPDAAAFREAVANQVMAAGKRQTPEALRARVAAVVAAVTEVAQRSRRLGVAAPRKSPLDVALGSAETPREAVNAAVRALAPLRRELLRAGEGSAAFYSGVERYVEGRLADSLSLDAAAKYFGLPPSTLTRRLERRYGLTFTGYIARRRVERAKTLLARTQLSVETVARRVGLTDAAHLRKLLRRFEGTTPTEARAVKRR